MRVKGRDSGINGSPSREQGITKCHKMYRCTVTLVVTQAHVALPAWQTSVVEPAITPHLTQDVTHPPLNSLDPFSSDAIHIPQQRGQLSHFRHIQSLVQVRKFSVLSDPSRNLPTNLSLKD